MTKGKTPDSELFRASVGQIKPVKNTRISSQSPKLKPSLVKQPDYIRADLPKIPQPPPTAITAENTIKFSRAGLSSMLLKHLRHGELTCDAVLDLHGLNYAEAQLELALFVRDCYEQKLCCVKVIHGKGRPHALLKNLVNSQLREYSFVDAFCSAPPHQGGSGALLVLLADSDNLLFQGV